MLELTSEHCLLGCGLPSAGEGLGMSRLCADGVSKVCVGSTGPSTGPPALCERSAMFHWLSVKCQAVLPGKQPAQPSATDSQGFSTWILGHPSPFFLLSDTNPCPTNLSHVSCPLNSLSLLSYALWLALVS